MLHLDLMLAARNLARQHTRTAISLVAIAFGVVALLVAGGFIQYIFFAMRESTINSGLGHIQVSRKGFADAGVADPASFLIPPGEPALALVRQTRGVVAVDRRLLLNGLIAHDDTTVGFTGEAVDPAPNARISTGLTVHGKQLSSTDPQGVLLGRGLAVSLGVGVGDTVTLLTSLPNGGVNGTDAHVVGTFSTQVKAYDDVALRMPLELGQRLRRTQGTHVWAVALEHSDDTDRVTAELRQSLAPLGFEVQSWRDLSDFYRKAVVLLSRQVDVVALLIAVIIVLGITNTLTMSTYERTLEIGTVMALGTSRRTVLRRFVIEGMLLGLTGGVLGVVIGVALAQLLSWIGIPMPPPPGRDTGYLAKILVTPGLAGAGFVLAWLAAGLASIYPAWRASRLPVVDALRHNR